MSDNAAIAIMVSVCAMALAVCIVSYNITNRQLTLANCTAFYEKNK